MNFRTTFPIPTFQQPLTHSQKIISVGSCFANMLGHKLGERKYQILSNPFGIIFNPISLFHLLKSALLNKELDPILRLETNGLHLHYHVHSEIKAGSKELLGKIIEEKLSATKEYLTQASHLFITLGTSFVYKHLDSGQLVANCHKQPAKNFSKRLLSLEANIESFEELHAILLSVNPKIQLIFTVSPVRHIKDGIPENQVSKSLLRVLSHQLSSKFANVHYFPSYELVMDDLRDYRFYQSDLLHVTPMAEDYIWEKFENAFLKEEEKQLNQVITSIQKDLAHKPFNPDSEGHQKFLKKLLLKIEQLPESLDFKSEKQTILNQLNTHEKR
ncbi:GSCFA domain-containing protein [Litoribacter ruber]|uniref:GSCFA domain-containing protein n=1 Tax=Litoribacter ruber TaxID=702568 RepID=A0AAP2G0Z3_9BACT|nr:MULTISPECIES: GSCFA domain-containing protein [Litoribacter]MBS9523207.1 GSCFA domain-containing protein [Litoribacter alkaliphilus]MBT0810630.1 GSCFA domain-containing protein [Litoribacter ruber]